MKIHKWKVRHSRDRLSYRLIYRNVFIFVEWNRKHVMSPWIGDIASTAFGEMSVKQMIRRSWKRAFRDKMCWRGCDEV